VKEVYTHSYVAIIEHVNGHFKLKLGSGERTALLTHNIANASICCAW